MMIRSVPHDLNIIAMHRRPKKLQNLAEKRPSLAPTAFKTPSLQEHTSKIQQKLSFLKQKISEKKKKCVSDRNSNVDQPLASFMARIALSDYLQLFTENGIDSLDILKEIKQSELQEIGVLKGHALKILVQLKKEEERARKGEKEEGRQQTKPSISATTIEKQATTFDEIQTDSFPVVRASKSFCLYCFSRSDSNFCSGNCEQLYNGMFSKYECNLQKAEESFVPKERREQELSDNQQFLQNFDFLFDPQEEDLDLGEYEQIKRLIQK